LSPVLVKIAGKNNVVEIRHYQNVFGKDIRGMVIYWCIAVAGGRRVENDSKKKRNKDMYNK
jgi:hypothetical protein